MSSFKFTVHYNTNHRLVNRDAAEVMLTASLAKMLAALIRPDGYRSLLSLGFYYLRYSGFDQILPVLGMFSTC